MDVCVTFMFIHDLYEQMNYRNKIEVLQILSCFSSGLLLLV